MMLRAVALFIGALDALVWLLVSAGTFWSSSDPATIGLDKFAGIVVTVLFFLTTVPALALAWRGYKLKLALVLSLAFPSAFAVLFVVAIIAFA